MCHVKYNPQDLESKELLADKLLGMLTKAGFEKEDIPGTKELVYSRKVNGLVRVVVYTSIVTGRTRDCGRDSIKVCAIYRSMISGRDNGIAKGKARIHRVGYVDEIIDRTITRMRDVWRTARCPICCPICGAPKFKSKKGNLVCCELCWTKDKHTGKEIDGSLKTKNGDTVLHKMGQEMNLIKILKSYDYTCQGKIVQSSHHVAGIQIPVDKKNIIMVVDC